MIDNDAEIVRLKPTTSIKPFECTNQDLKDFLLDDAVNHLKELLAVTYLYESKDTTIGYFSVLNDSIRRDDTDKKGLRKALKKLPHGKRSYKSHPAVKVGRLAVHTDYQSKGIGGRLMDYIKGYFLDRNKTGCRFIIVDADNNERTLQFYQRNGFSFLTEKDKDDKNRLMYFDLILYANLRQSGDTF